MKCKDEKQRLITYISKLLNKVEKNYEIHNKKYQQLSDTQRHENISQKKPRVSLRFGQITNSI